MRQRLLATVMAATALALFPAPAASVTPMEPDCTLVLGFSQTADWYMAPAGRSLNPDQPPQAAKIFQSQVGSDRWQLKWANGAGVDVWGNPGHFLHNIAWNAPILFPCAVGSDEPDRIVFTISGPFGTNEAAWADAINVALDKIRDEFPIAKVIALQPVVGAPRGLDVCLTGTGAEVRASWQYKHIVAAIEVVAAQHDDVLVGALTTVRDCDHYADALGHLTPDGGAAAAAATGKFYRDFSW